MFRLAASANQTGEPVTMPSENIVHVAIELSFSSWLVAARLPGAEKSRLHRIEGGDTTALLALIAELRSRASTKLGRAVDVACCFEAGRDGVWLHRLLTAHDIAASVLEPTSILVNRRARRGQTDPLDAEGMLRVLGRGWPVTGRCAAWCTWPRPRRRTPNARTASANTSSKTGCASRTGLRRCCSRRASGAGHRCARGGATWSSCAPATDARCPPCCGPSWIACGAGLSWSWS